MNLLEQLEINLSKGVHFVEEFDIANEVTDPIVRLIAYYLPQFHPIPENDRWWGKGFTEWTNVTKTLPAFSGHYQPHLPSGLGFYDLRVADTLREQAKLAKKFGVAGFCFHRYWFNGRTLLETPLNILRQNIDIDIGFCLNWANENWSRRWNGGDKEVLFPQTHSPDDDISFAKSMMPFFNDKRYIRVNGRPLLMVYRPSVLPDAKATIKRWRKFFRDEGISDPYIVMAQTYNDLDPRAYGMDAAAGFPPHNTVIGLKDISDSLHFFTDKPFGRVYDYNEMAKVAISNNPSDFTLLPGVCPGWDSSARYSNGGAGCFFGASPIEFERWLRSACDNVRQLENQEEHIVFINAWNEWAEGAHLEPDRHFGYGYLAAVRRVIEDLHNTSLPSNNRMLYSKIQLSFLRRIVAAEKPVWYRLIRKVRNMIANFAESLSKKVRMK